MYNVKLKVKRDQFEQFFSIPWEFHHMLTNSKRSVDKKTLRGFWDNNVKDGFYFYDISEEFFFVDYYINPKKESLDIDFLKKMFLRIFNDPIQIEVLELKESIFPDQYKFKYVKSGISTFSKRNK